MIVRGKSGRATGAPYKPNLTEPDSHVRCYIRDPDGHLIEVGQSTRVVEARTPA